MSRRRPTSTTSGEARTSRAPSQPSSRHRRAKQPRPPAKSKKRPPATKKPKQPASKLTRFSILAGLTLTTVLLGGQWVLHLSIFRVQHVFLTGVHHESNQAVLRASGLEAHPTMAGISAHSIQVNLKKFTWITGVSVTKHWPNTLYVRVEESKPVAVAFTAQHVLHFVSPLGQDLGRAPLNANLPTLQYLMPLNATWPYARAGQDAALVASEIPGSFGNQVSLITINAAGVVALHMTTPVTFVLGQAVNLQAKFVAIASVITHSTLRPGDIVDVSVPDELAVSGPAPL